jgi:aerobic-type carbon monoxide dehydrogenase small subunit (CoxS/CutS family)
MLLAAHALITRERHPSDAAIDEALDANLCRCGSYQRIRQAVKLAAARRGGGG